jgi:hypothetical protein
MDVEMLTRMDAEADQLIKSWSSSPFSEDIDMETCTQKMGTHLNRVYGTAALPLDLIAGYGSQAGSVLDQAGWVLDQAARAHFVITVAKELWKVYRDRANGKEAPKPEEFRNRIVGRADITLGELKLKATATVKDGSADSR